MPKTLHTASAQRLKWDEALWVPTKDGDPTVLSLYERHYSAHHYKDNRVRKLCAGPGQKTVLITPGGDAVFIWRKFISQDVLATGICCAVFRNESRTLSSLLILAAERHARARWPDEAFYTYINAEKVRSTNPGYCFKKAGWRRTRTTKGGLIVLEKDPSRTHLAETAREPIDKRPQPNENRSNARDDPQTAGTPSGARGSHEDSPNNTRDTVAVRTDRLH